MKARLVALRQEAEQRTSAQEGGSASAAPVSWDASTPAPASWDDAGTVEVKAEVGIEPPRVAMPPPCAPTPQQPEPQLEPEPEAETDEFGTEW